MRIEGLTVIGPPDDAEPEGPAAHGDAGDERVRAIGAGGDGFNFVYLEHLRVALHTAVEKPAGLGIADALDAVDVNGDGLLRDVLVLDGNFTGDGGYSFEPPSAVAKLKRVLRVTL